MRIGLLSGAYPQSVDGIGDYAYWLARELSRRHEAIVFTGHQNSYAPDEKVSVVGVFDPASPATIRNLPGAIAAGPALDRLVVQYNPFSFGPRGFNPWLPIALSRLPKHLHLSLMFHEIYVPCKSPAQFAMRLWQLPQFFFLSRMAASIYSSCSRWLPVIRRATGRNAVHLPVGSNIVRSTLSRDEARKRLKIGGGAEVFGVFGSAHPSRLLHWICEAANRVASDAPETVVVYVGADGEALRPGLGPGIRFLDCGRQDGGVVGDFLMAVDFLLAPFADGLSTRRGSVVAAFQHGIPVVSTSSGWTDEMLLGQEERLVFLSPVDEGSNAFASLASAVSKRVSLPDSRQAALCGFYSEHFGWPSICRRLQ